MPLRRHSASTHTVSRGFEPLNIDIGKATPTERTSSSVVVFCFCLFSAAQIMSVFFVSTVVQVLMVKRIFFLFFFFAFYVSSLWDSRAAVVVVGVYVQSKWLGVLQCRRREQYEFIRTVCATIKQHFSHLCVVNNTWLHGGNTFHFRPKIK